jgi:hypothetical protein
VGISCAWGIAQWRSQTVASQRWVGGGSLPHRWGKWRKEGSFGRHFPIYSWKRERERGSGPGPARRWWMAHGLPVRRECGTMLPPVSVGLVRGTVGLKPTRATVPPGRAQSIKPNVFLFFKLTWIYKLWKPPFVAPKFTKLFNMIECKIRNMFTFGDKFKCETEFELKFLEAKVLLNLGQIYWGFKLVWKNLINSPKFLFALAF